ncbi:MAG TPA: helix-turn-helix domain-containing protein [Solirubrobacteraceae bacterium]|nr:helix-turn-helix domain-containing protein [Solirubrobacteraceae bacterium]
MANVDEKRSVELMSIGAFAERTRLSPKALRLYDELGLLAPARVDESSGYRYYDASQLEQARLVAALRRLDMPLPEVKAILELDSAQAVQRLEAYWALVESEHVARRELAAYLVDRINGKRSVMYEVMTRDMPVRSVLCLKRTVHGHDQAWALGKEFVALMREHPLPRLEPPIGAAFCIFYSELSEDADTPLEWCRPVPENRAQELAEAVPELTLRTEPAHREAFVHIGQGGETSPAQWELVSESLRTWAEGRDLRPADLGVRITYTWNGPGSESTGPDCDFVVPFAA